MPYCKKCGKELRPEADYCPACRTPTGEIELFLASWGERFLAFIIDSVLVSVVVGVFPWPRTWTPINFPFLNFGVTNIFLFLYWSYLEGTSGKSFGKRVMNIRVVDLKGKSIEINQSIYQAIGKAFLAPIDVIIGLILYPGRRQRLFNNLSYMVVVKE
jgi:uncharacterized RDD family membrane protein YckC